MRNRFVERHSGVLRKCKRVPTSKAFSKQSYFFFELQSLRGKKIFWLKVPRHQGYSPLTYIKAARRFPALSRPYSASLSAARAATYESALSSSLQQFHWISIRNILITILRIIICFRWCVLCGAHPNAKLHIEKAANKKCSDEIEICIMKAVLVA